MQIIASLTDNSVELLLRYSAACMQNVLKIPFKNVELA